MESQGQPSGRAKDHIESGTDLHGILSVEVGADYGLLVRVRAGEERGAIRVGCQRGVLAPEREVDLIAGLGEVVTADGCDYQGTDE